MAGKMTIPIVRDTNYEVGDRLELEIDAAVQPDLIQMWSDSTMRDSAIAGGTVPPLAHETLSRFPAGDYSVRLRGIDMAGNVGAWMVAQTIWHRPMPETPVGLAMAGGDLTGDWEDV